MSMGPSCPPVLKSSREVSGQLEQTGKRSHPWVLAVLQNGVALGVLADTTRRCEIDLCEESKKKIVAPASYPIITFGPLPSPTAVLSVALSVGDWFFDRVGVSAIDCPYPLEKEERELTERRSKELRQESSEEERRHAVGEHGAMAVIRDERVTDEGRRVNGDGAPDVLQ
ncbi:hypothetical protein Syun_003979 [Stephania yunnanensis]|uniref:Uncharacterized protein n=1 Tax=Stephania yunnanensis TaxID=152371 RepID=A0AAP0L251_9MAGN